MELSSQIDQTRRLSNKQFRLWVQENEVSRFYSSYVHICWNIGILFLLALVNALLIENWNWKVVGVYIFTLLFGDFLVWALHRYPLHHRYKYWSYPYERHTVMHHRYFTQNFITYDNARDFYAVFFPMKVIAGFALLAQPAFFFGVKYFLGHNLAFAFTSGTAIYFLLYEFVHWTSHLPEAHFLISIPWLRRMRHHHQLHHNPRLMMKFNFGIVSPLADFLLGTKYKEAIAPKDDDEDHYLNVKANL